MKLKSLKCNETKPLSSGFENLWPSVHRLEDQDRRENGDHDENDKLDDEMKQRDANFSDQSNNFSFWRYQKGECQNLLRFFHCANFAETFVNCQLCKNISKTK